ncbi:hypothetical protein DXT99_00565 [Pontibacter diazotrophicus]|uniref:Lipoprotein n=1 Tax=Pontibacter diazotrophicus TaxID=1400979 RepID=A0A3D8LIA7_9BACT|nr:hypothetical protein [Pontibacter diazotrophicus]RDV17046.1 hypothetical protein DXT99_00565 [Pontibacter diazotrophicus]
MKKRKPFISKFRYLVLAVFSCLTMGLQCDEYVEPEYSHIIQETLSLTPYKKTYNVGDTNWVETNLTGKYLYDTKIFQRVLIDSVSLPLKLFYHDLYKNPSSTTGGFVKAIHPDLVEKQDPYLFFYYACNQPDYKFKVGLVLLTPGIYSLRISDQNYFSNCITQASYSRIYYKFDLEDSNKDIFLAIPPISRGGLNTDKMDAKEEFIVQVVL